MEKVKSYTDLEQSEKLAKILPLSSADMRYHTISQYNQYPCDEIIYTIDFNKPEYKDIPCWSLAALLSVLPRYELNNFGDAIQLDVKREALETEDDETLLDLVVNMIIHLHELKKL
jgi:hypothetical protein